MTFSLSPANFIDPNPTLAQNLSANVGSIVGNLLRQRQQREAYRKLNIDPEVANLPKEVQQAYIKAQQKNKYIPQALDIINRRGGSGATSGAVTTPQTPTLPTVPLDPSINPQQVMDNTGLPQDQPIVQPPPVKEFTPRTVREDIPTPQEIQAASLISPNLAASMQKERDEELKAVQDQNERYFKANEEKAIDLNNRVDTLEQEYQDFTKMKELNSDPSKFPATWVVGLDSFLKKDGGMSKALLSQLTPEAALFYKLLKNQLKNIPKNSGGKITDTQVNNFLARLPDFAITPEGRDLILNELISVNRKEYGQAKGLLDIFDEFGGTEKIPYSKVQSIYRNRNKNQDNSVYTQFGELNPRTVPAEQPVISPNEETTTDTTIPETTGTTRASASTTTTQPEVIPTQQSVMNTLPDPVANRGRKIRDTTTGKIYISDGKSWREQPARVQGLGASLFAS